MPRNRFRLSVRSHPIANRVIRIASSHRKFRIANSEWEVCIQRRDIGSQIAKSQADGGSKQNKHQIALWWISDRQIAAGPTSYCPMNLHSKLLPLGSERNRIATESQSNRTGGWSAPGDMDMLMGGWGVGISNVGCKAHGILFVPGPGNTKAVSLRPSSRVGEGVI